MPKLKPKQTPVAYTLVDNLSDYMRPSVKSCYLEEFIDACDGLIVGQVIRVADHSHYGRFCVTAVDTAAGSGQATVTEVGRENLTAITLVYGRGVSDYVRWRVHKTWRGGKDAGT